MAELHELSAVDLAGAIRRREVSSREALHHLVARADRLDGPLNSIVTRDLDAAETAAAAADAAIARGDEVGPLHGVPMTIKDSFSTAGMRTTSGAPELSDHVPTEDAWPVAGLRRTVRMFRFRSNRGNSNPRTDWNCLHRRNRRLYCPGGVQAIG